MRILIGVALGLFLTDALCLLFAVPPHARQDDDIETLIRLLDSKEPAIASHAREALLDLGSRALPGIERVAKGAGEDKRKTLHEIAEEIRAFEKSLEDWKTDRLPDLLEKLDGRAELMQRRFSRRAGKVVHFAAILDRSFAGTLGSADAYTLSTYNFEHATRDDVQRTRNNPNVLFERGRLQVRMVVDHRSEIWDLGETDFDRPDLGRWEERKEAEDLDAKKKHVFVIHTNDSSSNLWTKLQILETRPREWILFRWEVVLKPTELMKLERRPDRLLKSRQVRLQIRAGHAGGNPNEVFMDRGHNAYLDQMSNSPLDMEPEAENGFDDIGFVKGGLLPLGKVWIVRSIKYKATVREQHGEFLLSVKGQKIVETRRWGREEGRKTLDDKWTGRIVIRPGEERTVFVETAYYSRCDVVLDGVIWDERFADAESFPDLRADEKGRLARLVDALEDDKIEARERALRDLIDWGPPISDVLEKMDLSKRSEEVRSRVKAALEGINGEP